MKNWLRLVAVVFLCGFSIAALAEKDAATQTANAETLATALCRRLFLVHGAAI